jgi:rubrerythrin
MIPEPTKKDLLNILGALNKAISMEKQAHFFYKAAADFTKSKKGSDMFTWLSKFEEGHVNKLMNRRKEILKNPLLEGVTIPPPEDTGISEADDSELLSQIAEDSDVLKLAIKNEKRAYVFYTKKSALSVDEGSKLLFHNFAREEDKHIEILEDQLHSLKMNKIYKDFEKF